MAVGAGTILGSFAARLGIDTNEYTKGILDAQGANSIFGQSFATFITNPLLGSIDLFKKAAAGAVSLGQAVLADAEAIQRLSQQTGATTDLLQALQARMEVAGFSSEQAGKALLVLSKNMEEARRGGGPLKEMFEQLGVSLAPGAGIDVGLAQLLDGLAGIPDEGVRSALAMRLLGEEAGPRLVNAVGGGSDALAAMIEEGRKLGQVFRSDAVDTLADFNTTIGYAGQAWEGFKRQLVAEFLTGFAGKFNTGKDGVVDFSDAVQTQLIPAIRGMGESFADMVGDLDDVLERFDRLLKKAEEFQNRGFWGNAWHLTGGSFNPVRGSTPFQTGEDVLTGTILDPNRDPGVGR